MKDWVYCPRCGSQLAHLGENKNPFVQCPSCHFVKYNNPLPATIGIIHDSDRLLLVRRADEPRKGGWDTVGGFLTPSETAEECLRREALEEIGCALVNLTPLGTYASVYGSTGLRTLSVAFLCSLPPGGEIRLSAENDAFAWYGPLEVPELAFDDVRSAVADALRRLGCG
ncbi:NUDIX domain-containing protein [Micromonospora chalcea]